MVVEPTNQPEQNRTEQHYLNSDNVNDTCIHNQYWMRSTYNKYNMQL